MISRRCKLSLVFMVVFLARPALPADWPMWRYDHNRSGVSPAALPTNLSLRWTVKNPPPRAAWTDPRLQFDAAFHPVVAGKMLVFGSSTTDTVTALDTESGVERWQFLAAAPVRLPPAIADGRVYFTADDGCLYCLELPTGRLLWKFSGAPKPDKVLGNERLISAWPARGGPVIHNGVVYFTAGIWPFMGVFVYAVDARDGRLLWHNDRPSAVYNDQPGATTATFGGASPQGALAIAGDRLAVPSGRAWPAYFDLRSGAMQPHAAGIKDSAGGGDSQIAAVGDYLLMGGCIFSLSQQRALLLNAAKPTVTPFTTLALLDGQTLYVATTKQVEAYDLSDARLSKLAGAYGRPLSRCDAPRLWSLPLADRVDVMIKAGAQLYLAGKGWSSSIETSSSQQVVAPWRRTFDGQAGSLVAADDKLFVSTQEGSLCCFAEHPSIATAQIKPQTTPSNPIDPEVAATLRTLLEDCRLDGGYAYFLGSDQRLARELIRKTNLHVVVLNGDDDRRFALHRRLLADRLYGERAAAITADASCLPPYLASVIVCESPSSAGFESPRECLSRLFPALRPYGGRLYLGLSDRQHADLVASLNTTALPGIRIGRIGRFTVVHREGKLPESADWAHEAGDAGNTWMGQDRRVKAPLGVLWFGGPGEDPRFFMQRHGDPPTARVCEGRIFMHGAGMITALDAYSGRLLWNRPLPKVRAYQNLRSNVEAGPPFETVGATAKRAALVAHPEGLYLSYGSKLWVWDPATGKTLAEYRVPHGDTSRSDSLYLGDLRLEDDVLVLGADFSTADEEATFVADDFAEIPAERCAEMRRLLALWIGESPAAVAPGVDRLVNQGNRLLSDPRLVDHVPDELKQQTEKDPAMRTAAEAARAAIERYHALQRDTFAPSLRIEQCNRRLMEAYFPQLRKLPPKIHWNNLYPWDGAATRQLAGLDRRSGRLLWRQHATHGFPSKSLSVGRGRVFCLDRTDPDSDDVLRRRGIAHKSEPRLKAFDLHTGKVLWTQSAPEAGYETFYSATHDVLVHASAYDPAPQQWWSKARDLSLRFVAHRGSDGQVLWDRTFTLNRPGGGHRMWYNWLVHDKTLLVESYRDKDAEFYGFDLLSGSPKTRLSPLTGQQLPWGFHRMGGCTKNVCCPNLVLFRSHTAGYFDITSDGGTANLGGFRPGCKNSLIPADGLLNAPNYASGCTCNYPVFTSLALVHAPEVEQWSTNDFAYDGGWIKRVGINLGAPGDRRAADGTLWLDFPSVGGPSPTLAVEAAPGDVDWFYRHSSRIHGSVPSWIVGSGGKGIASLTIRLGKDPQPTKPLESRYTVRLYFAECDPIGLGQRVFSVLVQDREVLHDFDIVREAGGTNIGVVKEFRGVAAGERMVVRLVARRGKTLLCGIELVAAGE